jgi:hypothetical protein
MDKDKWTESHLRTRGPVATVSTEQKSNVSMEFLDLFRTGANDDAALPDPAGRSHEKAQYDALVKREGVAEARWDEPLPKSVALPADFLKRSNLRFEKASAVIKKIFANDQKAETEAIALFQKALADARSKVLARVAA